MQNITHFHSRLYYMHPARGNTKKRDNWHPSEQGCGVGIPGVWIVAQGWSRSQSQSCQKRGLRIGRTCFSNLTEYNEIMDSA